MSKSIKRIIMLLLAVAIAAGAPLTVFAQPEPDVEAVGRAEPMPAAPAQPASPEGSMETALLAAKTLLDIDDEVYVDFSYSSNFSNYETREGLTWSFSWSDNKNGYIYAVVLEDGTVLQYYNYDNRGRIFGFAEISKEAATKNADEFIKKAKPDTYSYYKAPADVYISIHGSDYRMNYYADVNGYPFSAAYVTVSINKFTGEVMEYYTSNVDPRNFNHESATDLIGESAAVAAYAEKIGLRLEYRSYYNYEDGEIIIFPAYLLSAGSSTYISAKSGEVVEYVYDLGDDRAAVAGGAASMAAPEAAYDMANEQRSGASLTPAEIAAIDKVSNYLTSEQALQKLLEAMDLKDLDASAFSQRYISLDRDYFSRNRYYYNINLYMSNNWDPSMKDDEITGLFGRVDAESGRVASFSINYNGTPYSGNEYTEEQAAAAVEAFLKKNAPDEFADTRIEEFSDGTPRSYNYRGDYSANYVRYANGIMFSSNSISATFNIYLGRITRYSLDWYDGVSFPSLAGVLAPERALSAFVAQNGSRINNITTGNGNTGLIYEWVNGGALIDPFTGEALGYNGEPQADRDVKPDYGDVAGHWSEAVVNRLLDNGVYLWGGKFEPNKVMTEYEFLQYLLLLEGYYYRANPAEIFNQRGIDIAADPDKTVTRQEAARIIVEYLGYGKLAGQPERFVYPFSDRIREEYKGYVTICYMLGIIGGDNGRFNASGSVTRAQAAVMLHNLIILKS